MKDVYKNWRCVVLIVLGMVALLLGVCESDCLVALVWAKVIAFADCLVCFLLGRKWAQEGKIDELVNLEE